MAEAVKYTKYLTVSAAAVQFSCERAAGKRNGAKLLIVKQEAGDTLNSGPAA